MKCNYILLLFTAIVFGCNKNISNDAPLLQVYKPAVIVGCDNGIMYSLDAETGDKNWEFHTSGAIKTTVLIVDDIIYFGNDAGNFYAINKNTGKLSWQKKYSEGIESSACFGDNKIYFGCNNDTVYCIDKQGHTIWTNNMGGNIICSPLFFDNKIYVGANKTDNFLCLDANTGIQIWKQDWITGWTNLYLSSPTVYDSSVFFGSDYYMVLAESTLSNTGGSEGFLPMLITAASPVCFGGALYCGGDNGTIYCMEIYNLNSNILWQFKTAGKIYSSAYIDEPTESIYVGSYDFNLYAINRVTGALKWKYPTASIIKSSPVILGRIIYFTSFDKYMYAVDKITGKLVWKYNLNNTSMCSPVINDLQNNIYPSISGMSKY
jgi:eukaryotic-like serine/threonine-protein kinase